MYILQFDGLFRKIPGNGKIFEHAGFMCYGWLIIQDTIIVARGHGVYARSNQSNSNAAEYIGLIEGLEALADIGIRSEYVVVLGDALSIIDQMRGIADVHSPAIKPLYKKALKLSRRFENIHFTWTPRKFNLDADALTRRALKQMHRNPDRFEELVASIHPGEKKARNKYLQPVLDLRIYHPRETTI